MVILFSMLFGLCLGSFVFVVIDRFPRGESILKGRSHCDVCGHILSLFDLIPILSFVFLGGRCRYCKSEIGYAYPLVEITTALLFIAVLWYVFPLTSTVSVSFWFVLTYIASAGLVVSWMIIFFIDLWYGIIPDSAVGLSILCGILLSVYMHHFSVANIYAAVEASGFFLLLYGITRGKGMGLGDVKYVFSLGVLLGVPRVFIGLYIAFLTGSVASFILILRKKKSFKGGTIFFGPFLILGTILSLFFGNYIWLYIVGFLR